MAKLNYGADKIQRTIKELYWASISTMFPLVEEAEFEVQELYTKDGKPIQVTLATGRTKVVDHLAIALSDGRFMELMVKNATELHEGSLVNSFRSYGKVISSLISNRKSVAPDNKTESWHKDGPRLEMLQRWVSEQRAIADPESKGTVTSKGKRPQWAYRPVEIDKIGSPDECQAVINSIADVCSAKFGQIEAAIFWLGENWKEEALKNRTYARNRKAALKTAANPEVASILASTKRTQSGRVSLTEADLVALVALIGKK